MTAPYYDPSTGQYAPQYAAPQAPQAPQYAPQYAAPQGAPPPQLAQGSLDEFFSQPTTGGGPALKFQSSRNPTAPKSWRMVVTRDVTDGDIEQQTQPGSNIPATYRDNRPKYVMKVPVMVQPTATIPDGMAQWYVQGGASAEMQRAMTEAGATTRHPTKGMVFDVTRAGERPSAPGMNPAAVWQVVCYLPTGQPPSTASEPAQPQYAPQPEPTPAVQYAPPVTYDSSPQYAPQPEPTPAVQYAPQHAPQPPAPQHAPQPPQVQVPVQNQPPAAPMQIPPGLDPDQAALFARMAGLPQG